MRKERALPSADYLLSGANPSLHTSIRNSKPGGRAVYIPPVSKEHVIPNERSEPRDPFDPAFGLGRDDETEREVPNRGWAGQIPHS